MSFSKTKRLSLLGVVASGLICFSLPADSFAFGLNAGNLASGGSGAAIGGTIGGAAGGKGGAIGTAAGAAAGTAASLAIEGHEKRAEKKRALDAQLNAGVTQAEQDLTQANTALLQTISDHKKGSASNEQLTASINTLNQNIATLNAQIKNVENAPPSKEHAALIKSAKQQRSIALATLKKAKK